MIILRVVLGVYVLKCVCVPINYLNVLRKLDIGSIISSINDNIWTGFGSVAWSQNPAKLICVKSRFVYSNNNCGDGLKAIRTWLRSVGWR